MTVNAFGSGAASNQDLSATLVAPKRDNADLPIPALGSAMSDLEFSDQSLFDPCNPFDQQSDECNYLQGGNPDGTIGTVSGSLHASLNPVFKGLNPKGTWRLIWRDDNADAVTTTLGETTLEVKTGRKFAKE